MPGPTERIVERLTARGVPFTIHEHVPARTVADALERLPFSPDAYLKTVAFRLKAGGWVLATLRGADRVEYRRLAAALGVPRLFPSASPRLVVRAGLFALLAGTVVLLAALEPDSGAEIVLVPMLLIGLGIGALASQLGAITVSAVPDDQSPEVGGIQNTMTNLGASMGTALAGSIMIGVVASSFVAGILASPDIPARVKEQAQVELAGGVPFISDADLEAALDDAHVRRRTTDAALEAYGEARIDGLRAALAILALLDLVALFLAQRIPTTPVGRAPE